MASGPGNIATLYADEHLRLHRRFQRRGLSAPLASDLVQETFVRLLRSQTGEIRDLRAYLYRVADSAEMDLRRAETRSRKVIEPGIAPDEAVADLSPAADAAMITQEEQAALQTAMGRLPPRPREVLFLHRFEGLSYAEISDRLGISRNTVMVHMVKALGLLRQQLHNPSGDCD